MGSKEMRKIPFTEKELQKIVAKYEGCKAYDVDVDEETTNYLHDAIVDQLL